MSYVEDIFRFIFAYPYYLLFIGVIVAVILLAASYFAAERMPQLKAQRVNLYFALLILALSWRIIASNDSTPGSPRWRWIVGFLPAILVVYQAFYLWLYHPKSLRHDPARPSPGAGATSVKADLKDQAFYHAQKTMDAQFSVKTLFSRYCMPAVLLGITGIVVYDIVANPQNFFDFYRGDKSSETVKTLLIGIKYGAAGAYTFVLLELGRRTFRHDVTGATAMWCLVALVLGPVIAAVIALLWKPESTASFGQAVVYFYAGYAPRRVISAIEQAAVQLLKMGPSVASSARTLPLSNIRGISPQIEERLSEEGILDVNALATTEPIRLVRNTSFDMRQILDWVDEAILIVTLPNSWSALEQNGITGAIDLVWYDDQLSDPATQPGAIAELTDLAQKGNITLASLISTIHRLSTDKQVLYISALYNRFTEYAEDDKGPKPTGPNSGGQPGGGNPAGPGNPNNPAPVNPAG